MSSLVPRKEAREVAMRKEGEREREKGYTHAEREEREPQNVWILGMLQGMLDRD